jgi:apolipoprotein D and lipocalin family protein
MTLSLTFLSPDLIKAAVEGCLPRGIGLTPLIDLPNAWPDQWAALDLKAPVRTNRIPGNGILRSETFGKTAGSLRPETFKSPWDTRPRPAGRAMIKFGMTAAILMFCVSVSLADYAKPPLPHVDMNSMYGGWYMIATIPNNFERGIVEPYDVYSGRDDGDIQEDFYFRPGAFDAPQKHFTVHDWVLPDTNNARWRVQIFWPINLPFLVLYTDPHYRYVIFGEDDRQLGWIYSRTQTIPDTDYEALLRQFEALGYDSSRLVKFVQLPGDIGKPGYWSEGVR